MLNPIKYVENAYSKNGTIFKSTTLEAILKHCYLNLPINGTKGQYGSIFVYESQQLGIYDDDTLSTGVILVDIDYISKEVADEIYKYAEMLADDFPCLLAIQYSSSYYNPNTSKNGLHLFFKSHKLTKEEYKIQAAFCGAVFVELVKKDLGINLLNIEPTEAGKDILDTHNNNMMQRFNLFYSTFKHNSRAIEFEFTDFTTEQISYIVDKYKIELDVEISHTIAPTLNNVAIGNVNKLLKIDRNFKIGNYSGNDVRFRISIIADKLFGDNAKMFCDKYFYYENNKSIYTKYSSANVINPLIYKWLIENGYIIENKQNYIKEWLTEYKTDIVKEIKSNNWLEIVAPTGTGKTTFINTYLAKQFNSVVIVPFNVTNKLYDNLFEVNSLYGGDIPAKKPIVMVWDQAVKHWGDIKDRHLIIDEAHTLFFDRTYRDKAIQLINLIKDNKSHTTFITATPAGEQKLFGMKQIKYFKKRDLINVNIKATNNIEWSQYNYIKKAIDNNWYDKIVLLDDTTAKKIYEQFLVNGYVDKIGYIRSSTKDSEDFISLRENEMLNKKLTICTCIAFNGLNFKNENEKVLVVGSIQTGKTTACEMIQQIGRIRKSNVTGLYFHNPNKDNKNDIDEKIQKAVEYQRIYIDGCPDTLLSYDRRYLDNDYINAVKNIDDYFVEHSTLDAIISELSETGYIKGKVTKKTKDDETIRMGLTLKRKESNEFKTDILNGLFNTTEYTTEYKKEWQSTINYLISAPQYSGITLDMFIELFNNTTDNKLVETSINNIREIIRYISIDEAEFDKVVNNMSKYANMLSSEINKRDFIRNIKRAQEIRNKYINKIKIINSTIDLTDTIFDVIEWESEQQTKRNEARVKGGQTKGKNTKEVTIDGITYKSVTEAAQLLGISRQAIHKRLNK